MIVLAADTSLPILSVALLSDGALIGSITLEGRSSRNEKLLPAIDWLLIESGTDRKDIGLLAATRGPGSFTGVRIGLATLQGLAMSLGASLCAMSTHEAMAHGTAGRVLVSDDAGRGEFYLSLFENGVEVVAPRLASAQTREELLTGATLLTTASLIESQNIALRCARRALDIQQRGEGDRYRDISPIYVRLAEAEVQLNLKR